MENHTINIKDDDFEILKYFKKHFKVKTITNTIQELTKDYMTNRAELNVLREFNKYKDLDDEELSAVLSAHFNRNIIVNNKKHSKMLLQSTSEIDETLPLIQQGDKQFLKDDDDLLEEDTENFITKKQNKYNYEIDPLKYQNVKAYLKENKNSKYSKPIRDLLHNFGKRFIKNETKNKISSEATNELHNAENTDDIPI